MTNIEPHFMAAFTASLTACEIVELLPESDLTDELHHILNTQLEILIHMLEGKHFGSNDLNHFMENMAEVKHQVKRLKEAT